MTELFRRAWRLTVGSLDVSTLSLSFDIEKTAGRHPNKASIKVINLTPDLRAELAQLSVNKKKGPGKIRVSLEAGYVEARGLIFQGDLRTAKSEKSGPEWETTIEGEDGGQSMRWSRINRAFPPGTPVASVVQACAEAMGVGTGNLAEAIPSARLEGGGSVFATGTVLSGSAPDELDGIIRSLGFTWSVQNGVLQILKRGRAIQTTAVRLVSTSGLVGSPARAADGSISFQCLINPEVYPGRQVAFEEPELRGTYRVKKAKYTGDTKGNDWYIKGEAVELLPAR